MEEISIVLAGIGGYGCLYAGALFGAAGEHGARLVAGIDPAPERSPYYTLFQEAGIPLYPDLKSFYRYSSADLAIISTAIHLHAPLTCLALANNSSVLCEKPVCASLGEARRMAQAERQAGRFVAVGYQWSFSSAIQALKNDILGGALGRPIRLKTKVLWPRSLSYYRRNGWAGRIKTALGEPVLDSPAHNATAHYLHNMFYLLGDRLETSAWPVDLQAEKYRANAIENYDAAALRCHTQEGVEILFYTAHPVAEEIGPVMHYEFEKAVVEYRRGEAQGFVARFHDGSVQCYGDPNLEEANKLWSSLAALRHQSIIACGIEAALPQLLCILGAQESGAIASFPEALLRATEQGAGDALVWVEGLQEAFEQCYEDNRLPAEAQAISWASAGRVVDLKQPGAQALQEN